jgi:hypothetical protein
VPCDFTHGTLSGYNYHRCRCDLCREAKREYDRAYREANRDYFAEYERARREADRERIAERRRDWHDANREHVAEYHRDWYDRNRYSHSVKNARRRAKRARIPGPRNGLPWTLAEDATVLRDDITIVEMCYLTGHSYGSVTGRRRRLRRARVNAQTRAAVERL